MVSAGSEERGGIERADEAAPEAGRGADLPLYQGVSFAPARARELLAGGDVAGRIAEGAGEVEIGERGERGGDRGGAAREGLAGLAEATRVRPISAR